MAQEYSEDIMNALLGFMDQNNYGYDVNPDEGKIVSNGTLKSRLGSVKFIFRVRRASYISYCRVNMNASEACRKDVMEYITRVNYGLPFGNFELDVRDGEIRFKYTVDCKERIPSYETIERSIDISLDVLERYGDGLLKVSFGYETPEEAIRKAEE